MIGDWLLGGVISRAAREAFEWFMNGWMAVAQWMIKVAYGLADSFSVFSTEQTWVADVWKITFGIGTLVAVLLAFIQIGAGAVRGKASGVVYPVLGGIKWIGVVFIANVMIASVNGLIDAISNWIREGMLGSTTLAEADFPWDFAQDAETGVKAFVMMIFGILSFLSAFVLWLELCFRQFAIMILYVTTPITASGLVSPLTHPWFSKWIRWLIAALLAKPAMDLALGIGVKMMVGQKDLSGFVAGFVGLTMACFAPWAIVRMFAFVESHGGMSGLMSTVIGAVTGTVSAAVDKIGGGIGGATESSAEQKTDSADSGSDSDADSGFGKAMRGGWDAMAKLANGAAEWMDNAGVGNEGGGTVPDTPEEQDTADSSSRTEDENSHPSSSDTPESEPSAQPERAPSSPSSPEDGSSGPTSHPDSSQGPVPTSQQVQADAPPLPPPVIDPPTGAPGGSGEQAGGDPEAGAGTKAAGGEITAEEAVILL